MRIIIEVNLSANFSGYKTKQNSKVYRPRLNATMNIFINPPLLLPINNIGLLVVRAMPLM